MRRSTILRRLRLAMFSKETIEMIVSEMRGVSDEQTEVGAKENKKWVESIKAACRREPTPLDNPPANV